ncbi:MAG: GNAT family N-acetyltransferase [Beijerinckiaceae bacterium]|nr:GNAT family N-acetyltransferase [Beijerinckiaceae bacterium]
MSRMPAWSILPFAALGALREEWRALASRALDPNPFYEPDFLLAAEALGEDGRLSVLVAREAKGAGALLALIPLRRPGWRQGWLRRTWMMHENAYTPLTTPLLDRERAPELVSGLLDAAPVLLPGSAWLIPLLPTSRPFWQHLRDALEAKGCAHLAVRQFSRAAIETDEDFEGYTGRHGQTVLRRERKLATHGRIHYVVAEGGTPEGEAMLEAFLALEAKGWKGRQGTALASRQASLAFARQAFRGASPATLYEALMLNDQPLAVNVNLLSGGVLYTVKAAFDEDYRGYSPGNLLDRHTIALATGPSAVTRVDSCANPDHPLELHWREREAIGTLLVDWTGSFGPAGLQRLATLLIRVDRGISRLSALRARWRGAIPGSGKA